MKEEKYYSVFIVANAPFSKEEFCRIFPDTEPDYAELLNFAKNDSARYCAVAISKSPFKINGLEKLCPGNNTHSFSMLFKGNNLTSARQGRFEAIKSAPQHCRCNTAVIIGKGDTPHLAIQNWFKHLFYSELFTLDKKDTQ